MKIGRCCFDMYMIYVLAGVEKIVERTMLLCTWSEIVNNNLSMRSKSWYVHQKPTLCVVRNRFFSVEFSLFYIIPSTDFKIHSLRLGRLTSMNWLAFYFLPIEASWTVFKVLRYTRSNLERHDSNWSYIWISIINGAIVRLNSQLTILWGLVLGSTNGNLLKLISWSCMVGYIITTISSDTGITSIIMNPNRLVNWIPEVFWFIRNTCVSTSHLIQ